jgi:hypothetical protein
MGLIIDDNLSWKNHIDHLMSKLNSACLAVRMVNSIMSQEALRIIYFPYVHSTITCGIIFWGNLPHSIKIFRIQKKIIRIITNSRNRDSCRELFQILKILSLCSQYIFSLLLYIVNNKQLFMTNLEIHKISTRSSTNLHPPISNLTKLQKGAYYSGIKIFIISHLTCLCNKIKLLRPDLKRFLYTNSFYSIEEYFNHNQ